MKRVKRPKFKNKSIQITKPFPIITMFSQQHCQSLLIPANKVQFAMNSNKLQQNIQRLKITASKSSSAIIAANQAGLTQKIITQLKKPTLNQMGKLQWIQENQGHDPSQYQCYINPTILYAKNPVISEQESVSYPFIHINAWRFNTIGIRHFNIERKQIQTELSGPAALYFQHGYDYFFGRFMLDWRLNLGNIQIQKDVQNRLPKTTEVIEQYSQQLKSLFTQYTHLLENPQQTNDPAFFQTFNKEQVLSIEKDFVLRIAKHYRKEMLLLLQKLDIEQQQRMQNK